MMLDVIFAFIAGGIIGACLTLVIIVEQNRRAWREYLPELTDFDIKCINEEHARRKIKKN